MHPGRLPQNRTTTSGKYTGRPLRQLVQHPFFHITETSLTLSLKKLTDRATQALLNHMVRIKEG